MVRIQAKQMLKGAAVAVLMLLPVPATSITNTPTKTPELPSTTAAIDLSAGAAAVEHRNYDLANIRLTRAIESGTLNDEALALAFHHRGIARQKLGFDALAVKDYTSALDIDALPRDVTARAYYNRGLAKSASGDSVGAELDYSHAIEFMPTFAAAYHNRANLERERHDYPTAIRDYSVALANLQGTDRKLPLMGRALSFQKAGNITAASADLDQLQSVDPNYPPAKQMRREIAMLQPAAQSTAVAAAAPRVLDDQLETGSIAPHHGEVIKTSDDSGWQTKTVRYVTPVSTQTAQAAQTSDDQMETGSLRAIDMVPAPGQQVASIEPEAPVEPTAQSTAVASVSDAQVPVSESKPQPAKGHFRVQLGAFRAPELATQAWRELSVQNAGLIDALNHSIEKADLGEKGTYFRLQAGTFETASAAKAKCTDFAAAKVDCIVVIR